MITREGIIHAPMHACIEIATHLHICSYMHQSTKEGNQKQKASTAKEHFVADNKIIE